MSCHKEVSLEARHGALGLDHITVTPWTGADVCFGASAFTQQVSRDPRVGYLSVLVTGFLVGASPALGKVSVRCAYEANWDIPPVNASCVQGSQSAICYY